MTIQETLVQHIADHIEEYDYPPSRRFLADKMGVSVSTVQRHLDKAVEDGLLQRVAGQPRAIRIVREKE